MGWGLGDGWEIRGVGRGGVRFMEGVGRWEGWAMGRMEIEGMGDGRNGIWEGWG